MRLKIKNNQKGFTIIETMIVLAIVAAITAGVFIMASTLRRNSRDNARMSDIGIVATSLVDYVAGSGKAPTGQINQDATSIKLESLSQYEIAKLNPASVLATGQTAQHIPVLEAPDAVEGATTDPLLAMNNNATADEGTIKLNGAGITTAAIVQNLVDKDQLLIISKAICYGDNKEMVSTDKAKEASVVIIYQLEKHNAPQCWQAVV